MTSEATRSERLRQLRALALDEGLPIVDRMEAEIERQHILQDLYDEELATGGYEGSERA